MPAQIGSARKYHYEAQEVHDEDEEEHREQIRGETLSLVLERGLDDSVIYEENHKLYRAHHLARAFHALCTVPAGYGKYTPYAQEHRDKDSTHIFGNGDVHSGLDFLTADDLYDLTLVGAVLAGNLKLGVSVAIHFTARHTRG